MAAAKTMAADPLLEKYRLRTRLPVYRRRVAQSLDIIREAMEQYRPYVAFSGGKDSMALLHLVNQVRTTPGYFFDSGAETPDTLAAVEGMGRICEVRVIRPRLSIIEMCRMAGWWGSEPPGDPVYWSVKDFREILIEEPSRRAMADGFDAVLLGMREEENRGRMLMLRHYGAIHQRKDGVVTINPLAKWEGADVIAYCLINGLPLSQTYLRPADDRERERRRTGTALGTSGATWGRLQILRREHPQMWQQLVAEFPRLSRLG